MSEGSIDTHGTYAVVTGAASGIGRELARQAVDKGLNVALADVSEPALKELASELEGKGAKVLARTVDVSSADEVEQFAQDVFGWADKPVTLVFANAGIHGYGDALAPDSQLWDRVLDVNVKGVVHTSGSFVQRLIDQQVPAQFVITASEGSFSAAPGISPYIASKHAVWGYAECLRMEVEQLNTAVGISIVAPSRTDSAMLQGRFDMVRREGGEDAVVAFREQLAQPSDIAAIAIRETLKRAFWIIPSHQSTESVTRDRFEKIFLAMPHGHFTPGSQL